MKIILPLMIIVAGVFFAYHEFATRTPPTETIPETESRETLSSGKSSHGIDALYKGKRSGVQVFGRGTVTRILPDDLKGSKHQRLIIKYSPTLTLLIAHNIDIAPRVGNIKIGDMLEFYGEYAWNKKGGVIHWTHKAPHGTHRDGYLKFKGVKYQ